MKDPQNLETLSSLGSFTWKYKSDDRGQGGDAPGAGVSVTFSSSALSPRAGRTQLLSHQCQMGRL